MHERLGAAEESHALCGRWSCARRAFRRKSWLSQAARLIPPATELKSLTITTLYLSPLPSPPLPYFKPRTLCTRRDRWANWGC